MSPHSLEHLSTSAHYTADGAMTQADIDAYAWFTEAVRTFLLEDTGLTLTQCLCMPATPLRARLAVRDYFLVRASQELQEPGPSGMLREAERFLGSKWPTWRGLGQAPHYANGADRAFFAAACMHDDFPRTRQGWDLVLGASK